ncbi:MAG: hypothetical protein J0H68_03805 [Sphingobacteriia bacterium]|nr:hypothetical protein [Sphingobacteriia bacterium]
MSTQPFTEIELNVESTEDIKNNVIEGSIKIKHVKDPRHHFDLLAIALKQNNKIKGLYLEQLHHEKLAEVFDVLNQTKTISSLVIDECFLSKKTFVSIQNLLLNDHLKSLELRNYTFHFESNEFNIPLNETLKAIENNTSLEELSLSGIKFNDNVNIILTIANILAKNKHIKKLNIENCELSSTQLNLLKQGLLKNTTLTHFSLKNSKIEVEASVDHLINMFDKEGNLSVTHLDFSFILIDKLNNSVPLNKKQAINLGKALANNKKLISLKMNQLSFTGVKDYPEISKNFFTNLAFSESLLNFELIGEFADPSVIVEFQKNFTENNKSVIKAQYPKLYGDAEEQKLENVIQNNLKINVKKHLYTKLLVPLITFYIFKRPMKTEYFESLKKKKETEDKRRNIKDLLDVYSLAGAQPIFALFDSDARNDEFYFKVAVVDTYYYLKTKINPTDVPGYHLINDDLIYKIITLTYPEFSNLLLSKIQEYTKNYPIHPFKENDDLSPSGEKELTTEEKPQLEGLRKFELLLSSYKAMNKAKIPLDKIIKYMESFKKLFNIDSNYMKQMFLQFELKDKEKKPFQKETKENVTGFRNALNVGTDKTQTNKDTKISILYEKIKNNRDDVERFIQFRTLQKILKHETLSKI